MKDVFAVYLKNDWPVPKAVISSGPVRCGRTAERTGGNVQPKSRLIGHFASVHRRVDSLRFDFFENATWPASSDSEGGTKIVVLTNSRACDGGSGFDRVECACAVFAKRDAGGRFTWTTDFCLVRDPIQLSSEERIDQYSV